MMNECMNDTNNNEKQQQQQQQERVLTSDYSIERMVSSTMTRVRDPFVEEEAPLLGEEASPR